MHEPYVTALSEYLLMPLPSVSVPPHTRIGAPAPGARRLACPRIGLEILRNLTPSAR
jgi:hypothetical protein